MDFTGRVAIVTGGKSGIGKAIAALLAERGADVVLANRDLRGAIQTAEEIQRATQRRVIAIETDVSQITSANQLIDAALHEFGRIDILINNAGVTRDNLIIRMDEDEWDAVININLKGTFNCSKAALRPMLRQRYGRIVNISSVSGLVGQVGQTNYSASKAGIIGFSKALAREIAHKGITVNVVAPGFVPTALTNDLPEALKEEMMKLIPMKRWGTVQEVAHAVAFLASEDAAYITGQVLCVDGGMTMV